MKAAFGYWAMCKKEEEYMKVFDWFVLTCDPIIY